MATPPRTKRPAGAKARAKPAAAAGADAAVEGAAGTALKKKDFMARVTSALGGRKGSVKDVADAVLQALSDAAHKGEDLILPPLGRIRVVKPKEGVEKPVAVTLKLRKIVPGAKKKTAAEPLAEDGEDS